MVEPGAHSWFLGFDCATRTFAFSLSRVDLGGFARHQDALLARLAAAQELLRRATAAVERAAAPSPDRGRLRLAAAQATAAAAQATALLDAESRAFLRLADGAVADLCPGRPDKEISTVERVQALARYVAARVRPALARLVPAGEAPLVVVEFQMGPNDPARMVAAALVALFADERVVVVGPTLKNCVATCPEGHLSQFTKRYRTSYGANKAHARFNFARIEAAFGSEIPPLSPPALRGHIADSFLQVLGLLLFGPKKDADSFF